MAEPEAKIPAAVVAAVPVIRLESCSKCKFANAVSAKQTECRRNPPTLMFAPMGQPGGGVQFAYRSGFVLVEKDWWCGNYVPRLALQQ